MKISLAGEWLLNSPKYRNLPVRVPGSVLSCLLEHGLIEDPFYRENEAAVRAVLYDDYTFSRSFSLTAEQLARANFLCLDGIDTVARVEINGHTVASLRNMHTPKKVLLDNGILAAENEIRVCFTSPYTYIANYPDRGLFETYAVTREKSPCLRKPNSMFGWDWGPDLADMGIVREISVLSTTLGYLEDFRHTVAFRDDGSAKLDLEINVNCLREGTLCAALSLNDTEFPYDGSQTAPLSPHTEFSFEIKNPRRWNPAGFGEPTLYTLTITLTGRNGEMQSYSCRIGLREVEIDNTKDDTGINFSVKINGKKIFLSGASYIPEDSILPRITPERTRRLLETVRDFGHNTVRVWGGGYYPADNFYDFCDENGILVWQDLMFACAVYNIYDEDFRGLITEEITANVKRFRHHAGLIIISGDNECEDGIKGHGKDKEDAYRVMSEEFLVPLMKTLTDTYFLRTSPRAEFIYCHANDLDNYDTHYWHVWGDEAPLELYETICPRMLSEVGHSAFPPMETIRSFAKQEDLSAESSVMNHHQKRPDCNGRILRFVREQYGMPRTFEDTVYLSQVMQAEAIRMVTEQLRRHRDICNGMIYWQLNDCWPGITWSSVDYFLRPKALHYASKRFFAPHFITLAEENGSIAVYAVNDGPEPLDCRASVQVQRFDGTVLLEASAPVSLEAACSRRVLSVPVPAEKNTVVYAFLTAADGSLLCENFRQPAKDREVRYELPRYSVKMRGDRAFELTADTFTKYIYLRGKDAETRFSDNFFTLRRGETKTVYTDRPVTPETLQITSVNQTRTAAD